MRKSFYHELLQPYHALVARAAKNDLVGEAISDITAAANALAVSAAHFLETKKLSPSDERVGKLRLMLQDVADTAKHGQLRDADRTVRLYASLAYEINGDGRSRFLRTEVRAANKKFGSFELIETLGCYLRALNDQFSFGFQAIEPLIELEPFNDEAVAKISVNTAEVGSTNIRTYKRDTSGRLIPADPTNFLFVVR